MDGRPLLILPQPQVAEREKPRAFGKPPHIPSHTLQSRRITPQFQRLLIQFRSRRAEIHLDPAGAPPEQVIVLETVGAVEEFVKAVKQTGMEWLGEFEEYEIPPDEDFFRDQEHQDVELTGRLYLVMTDQQAIRLMLSLWNHYRKDENYKFPRGLTKWRDVFKHLRTSDYGELRIGYEILECWKTGGAVSSKIKNGYALKLNYGIGKTAEIGIKLGPRSFTFCNRRAEESKGRR